MTVTEDNIIDVLSRNVHWCMPVERLVERLLREHYPELPYRRGTKTHVTLRERVLNLTNSGASRVVWVWENNLRRCALAGRGPPVKKPKVPKPSTISPEQLAINVAASRAKYAARRKLDLERQEEYMLMLLETRIVRMPVGPEVGYLAVTYRHLTRAKKRALNRLITKGLVEETAQFMFRKDRRALVPFTYRPVVPSPILWPHQTPRLTSTEASALTATLTGPSSAADKVAALTACIERLTRSI